VVICKTGKVTFGSPPYIMYNTQTSMFYYRSGGGWESRYQDDEHIARSYLTRVPLLHILLSVGSLPDAVL